MTAYVDELKSLLGGDTKQFDFALSSVVALKFSGGADRAAYVAEIVNSLGCGSAMTTPMPV